MAFSQTGGNHEVQGGQVAKSSLKKTTTDVVIFSKIQ